MLEIARPIDRRRQATREEIVAAAWRLAREEGIAAVSLRSLAGAVGMRAPSLYSYFASKNDLYDALFADGYRAFLAQLTEVEQRTDSIDDAGAVLAASGAAFMEFCRQDIARYQLLFTPAVPGFVPSESSMELARTALAMLDRQLDRLGIADPAAADLLVAVITGLVNQQIANDPEGDRWEQLIPRAAEMLVSNIMAHADRGER